jgi:hypothetical protein
MVHHHIVRAPPALKRFLDARERGASQDILRRLAVYAEDEQKAEQAKAHKLRLAEGADNSDGAG